MSSINIPDILTAAVYDADGDLAIDRAERILLSSNDTTADYLENKTQNTASVSWTVINDGANEKLTANVLLAGVGHNLLSATHLDTTAASPARGDLVTAQTASPVWQKLALGASSTFVKSDGTDVVYANIATSDVTSGTFVNARIAQSNVTQHVAAIDHDSLLNFVAAEHINWSATGAEDVHDDRISLSSVTQHINDAGTGTTDIWSADKIQDQIDAAVASEVTYKGGYDANTNTPDLDVSPSGVEKGDMYTVTAAGTFFTTTVEIGDVLIAEVDDADAEDEWTIVNKNLDFGVNSGQIPDIATTLGNNAIVETNGSGQLITATKATGYNKAFGTGSGTVMEGDQAAGGHASGTLDNLTIDHDGLLNFVAGEHFLQSAITTVGTVATGNVDAVVSAATTTLAGKVELATTAEINTGTDATRAMTPDLFAASNFGRAKAAIVVFGTETAVTTLTVGTDDLPFFVIPAELNGMDLVDCYAFVYDKGVTGTTDVKLIRRRAGANVDMLSTAITLGDEWYASDGVINGANDDVQTGDMIIAYVSGIHSGTAPNGLTVMPIFEKIT